MSARFYAACPSMVRAVERIPSAIGPIEDTFHGPFRANRQHFRRRMRRLAPPKWVCPEWTKAMEGLVQGKLPQPGRGHLRGAEGERA